MWASSEAAAADVSVGDDGVPTPDHGTPLAAHALAWWLPQPCDLALVGAAAFASGVTRAVSTVVIVFELASGDTAGRVALPLGVACLAAVFVGEALGTNVYDALIGTRRAAMPSRLSLGNMPENPPSRRYERAAVAAAAPAALPLAHRARCDGPSAAPAPTRPARQATAAVARRRGRDRR